MAEIFICKPGAITTRAARALGKRGIVVVETEDPKAVTFLRAGEVVAGSTMLAAALTALAGNSTDYIRDARARFMKEIAAAAMSAVQIEPVEAKRD